MCPDSVPSATAEGEDQVGIDVFQLADQIEALRAAFERLFSRYFTTSVM
jgi:hypothetical protein